MKRRREKKKKMKIMIVDGRDQCSLIVGVYEYQMYVQVVSISILIISFFTLLDQFFFKMNMHKHLNAKVNFDCVYIFI
jgi:hypothetical protein